MRISIILSVLALLTVQGPAPVLAAEGVSIKDVTVEENVSKVTKDSVGAVSAAREAKQDQPKETSQKKVMEKPDASTGDLVITGKTKEVLTLSGTKSSETQSNVGSINVSK